MAFYILAPIFTLSKNTNNDDDIYAIMLWMGNYDNNFQENNGIKLVLFIFRRNLKLIATIIINLV